MPSLDPSHRKCAGATLAWRALAWPRRLAALLCCATLLFTSLPAAVPAGQAFDVDLGRAMHFCMILPLGMEYIRTNFPDLATAATQTEANWEAAFGAAARNIEARMLAELKEADFIRFRALTKKQIEVQWTPDTFTHEMAKSFLANATRFAKGDIKAPILPVLLASHPDFIKNPELEFAKFTTSFSTKEHPKAHGVRVKLKVPGSWVQRPATQQNIIETWVSDFGYGKDSWMLSIKKLPLPATPETLAVIFSEAGAKDLLGDDKDAGVFGFPETALAGKPLAITRAPAPAQRMELKLTPYTVHYYMVSGDYLVSIQATCGATTDTEQARAARLKQLEPLFRAMIDSVSLPAAKKP